MGSGAGIYIMALSDGVLNTQQSANLSFALRVFVLRHYMDQSARHGEMFEQREFPVQ
jgi:hypothetical protein